MGASQTAHLISYVVLAIVALWAYPDLKGVLNTPEVRWPLLLILLFNSLYYFFASLFIELDSEVSSALSVHRNSKTVSEWLVRLLICILLYTCWVLLPNGLILMGAALLVIYILCIIWDLIVRKCLDSKTFWTFFILDGLATLASATWFLVSYEIESWPFHRICVLVGALALFSFLLVLAVLLLNNARCAKTIVAKFGKAAIH